jgi:hypothetical protein
MYAGVAWLGYTDAVVVAEALARHGGRPELIPTDFKQI